MPASAARPMTPREWGLLGFLSLVWGGSFFFNAVALQSLPVLSVVAARVTIAALVLGILVALRGGLPRGARVWGALLLMGILNSALPFSLIVWAQTSLPSGVAAILNATTPMFTGLIAHAFTRDEKLTPGRIAGTLLGFAGVAVLVGPGVLAGVQGWAPLASLGAALSYGFAGVFGRRLGRMGVAPMSAAAGQLLGASLILAPLALTLDRPWTLPAPGLPAVAAVLGLALLSTALAYVVFFRLLASAGAMNLALVTLLVPVSALLLGALFLGEALTAGEAAGMALIALGLAAIDGRAWRALTGQARAASADAAATSAAASGPEAQGRNRSRNAASAASQSPPGAR